MPAAPRIMIVLDDVTDSERERIFALLAASVPKPGELEELGRLVRVRLSVMAQIGGFETLVPTAGGGAVVL